jgi:hypothetical protein
MEQLLATVGTVVEEPWPVDAMVLDLGVLRLRFPTSFMESGDMLRLDLVPSSAKRASREQPEESYVAIEKSIRGQE